MEAFWIATGTVFLGELGDKTQLLAVMLASRFRRPWIVVAGILLATVLNHAVAGLAGSWIRTVLPDEWLHWIVGLSFIAVGLWAIKPDGIDESEAQRSGRSVLWITVVSFFLAEIGDKTQIATTVLAARFDDLLQVVAGTTSGMLLADVPVVFLGAAIATRLPLTAIRWTAAGLFVVLGVTTLIWGGTWLGVGAGQAG
ncbi:TMEM165/GDT1 family protein [Algiphilus sp. W345]|uniref:GDT1 family protein n=1 Tax=Banduia mediterranea TaxID=3075609 RepID=A0ABU2WHK0_9GAMM|nr:TMEM165/GDT1 family protein [Algiphilus sp. W345]MDT0497351.1 TMEM165/GDT1 family protein [Algiphilus sp. W345]